MKLSDFDFKLPKELIAQYPLYRRDDSRLLILNRKTGKIIHAKFSNILDYLPRNSTLILNDSKVIPARLFGKREFTQGKVEVLLLNKVNDEYTYQCLIKPLKKLKDNEAIMFDDKGFSARLVNAKEKLLRFNTKDVLASLNEVGRIPLPPYIKRKDTSLDKERYQTVYSRHDGSVASPTAGLHFTDELLNRIKSFGIKIGHLTLHVNYATFNPVKAGNVKDHVMYAENFKITKETVDLIKSTKLNNEKIIAVGTTSTRSLETIANVLYRPESYTYEGVTGIYIYPGYKFKLVDILVTNFHTPRSTLLLLVCAFAGRDLIMKAYKEAIKKKYRFYSYGDAMLIL